MRWPSLEQRILYRAKQRAGSAAALAEAMGVDEPDLEKWMDGLGTMPTWAFLRAVEVVNDGGRSLRAHVDAARDPAGAPPP